MKLFNRITLLLFTLLICNVAVAKTNVGHEEGLMWLVRMVESFSSVNYEGVFVRSQGNEMNSMRLRHIQIDGVEYESLVDLDGQRVEVIRVDNNVICVYPDISFANTTDPISTPLKQFKELNGDRLKEGYDFLVGNITLVAGRKAQRLTLSPKDDYRFGHDFWLDVETGFLLKHDTVDASKKVLDRVQFTDFSVDPNLTKQDFIPRMGFYAKHVVEVSPKEVPNKWRFDWLPNGFAPVWRDAHLMNDNTAMLLLSDGMTSISVFIEPTDIEQAYSVMQMGSTTAGEITRVFPSETLRVTIIGEVPPSTVEKLLMSFRQRENL
jgi:sigma-E factor negative regulatory protein RseB